MASGQYPPDPREDAQRSKQQESKQQGSKQEWQQKIHEAVTRTEEDLRKVAQYINDEVVPDVRRHGSETLRVAAEELRKLAQRLEDLRTPRGGSPREAGSSSGAAPSSSSTGEPKP
jgi:hypothetical protein